MWKFKFYIFFRQILQFFSKETPTIFFHCEEHVPHRKFRRFLSFPRNCMDFCVLHNYILQLQLKSPSWWIFRCSSKCMRWNFILNAMKSTPSIVQLCWVLNIVVLHLLHNCEFVIKPLMQLTNSFEILCNGNTRCYCQCNRAFMEVE